MKSYLKFLGLFPGKVSSAQSLKLNNLSGQSFFAFLVEVSKDAGSKEYLEIKIKIILGKNNMILDISFIIICPILDANIDSR